MCWGQGRSGPELLGPGVWAAVAALPSPFAGRKMDARPGARPPAASAQGPRSATAQAVRDPDDRRVGAD